MELELSGIVIIVGAYGSGKTEVAINLALHMNARGANVRLADLDLVNLISGPEKHVICSTARALTWFFHQPDTCMPTCPF